MILVSIGAKPVFHMTSSIMVLLNLSVGENSLMLFANEEVESVMIKNGLPYRR